MCAYVCVVEDGPTWIETFWDFLTKWVLLEITSCILTVYHLNVVRRTQKTVNRLKAGKDH